MNALRLRLPVHETPLIVQPGRSRLNVEIPCKQDMKTGIEEVNLSAECGPFLPDVKVSSRCCHIAADLELLMNRSSASERECRARPTVSDKAPGCRKQIRINEWTTRRPAMNSSHHDKYSLHYSRPLSLTGFVCSEFMNRDDPSVEGLSVKTGRRPKPNDSVPPDVDDLSSWCHWSRNRFLEKFA